MRRNSAAAPSEELQARIRHDLRTPLNAILGYSELALEDLGEGADAERMRADIERLLDEARRLMRSIDTVVDLTRTGVGPTGEAVQGAADAVVAGLLRTLAPSRELRTAEVGRIAHGVNRKYGMRRRDTTSYLFTAGHRLAASAWAWSRAS